MAPKTQTTRETATAETIETEDGDGIHRIHALVTTEAAGTTPMKTSGEGSLTIIQDGPHSL
ncbi:hypothetical protein A2U01_0043490 [Trifolium medium]|uniref:Uncharacterized protein n=1 Tax=Trifolium medium TaxID=97028 RepID=A0A392QDS0_9FABA|nr:hypothetical protein [Trifolium medium]